ncbi:EamA family transporter [Dickeya dianthicola]|uniref:EamA family transporter n=1 Tax=Dickeya dianthicola TaxID=204039 RepID=UPI0013719699|nr:EamA family transporter [Dickeya dianthicola]MCI4186565.1 EamA family transporter [Dickeya dianthicola]MCI4237683.1 EamA family transporter [Dickeya dianthicola]MCI4256607.1 EamA family transporter [Dickeya dianthicola]MZG23521.1 EamA family transporter [Dickeya dianthicola]MZI90047.1 EamA family transporter [Dickeya dianthicola]
MKTNLLSAGVVSGVIFCGISAAFDVFVANITQNLEPAVFIVYCFIISTVVFLTIGTFKNGTSYLEKAKRSIPLLSLVNIAVLLNWGGLIFALKYLEPAVVGIASVACGPALTIVISRYFIRGASTPDKAESSIAWIILFGVIVMLINSYFGKSGVINTSYFERTTGIICVICSAIGTVLYTFYSKDLSKKGWKSYEILGFRNILMLLVALGYCAYNNIHFYLTENLLLIVIFLSVIGHVIPIFLIQKSISTLDPIHVSLLLLLLPVFTLALQFFDDRIFISWESISAVFAITFFLIFLCVTKIHVGKKGV